MTNDRSFEIVTYDKSASFADRSSTQESEKGIQGNPPPLVPHPEFCYWFYWRRVLFR